MSDCHDMQNIMLIFEGSDDKEDYIPILKFYFSESILCDDVEDEDDCFETEREICGNPTKVC